MPPVGMIWAQGRDRAIGAAGRLPWHLPEDLALFKRATVGCPVIMGRRTWESLDARFRPLPGRQNIVLTGDARYAAPGAQLASTIDQALVAARGVANAPGEGKVHDGAGAEAHNGAGAPVHDGARAPEGIGPLAEPAHARRIWIIGGAKVYEAALEYADLLVVTDVDVDVPDADAFAPAVDFTWKVAQALPERGWLTSRTGLRYRCTVYCRPGAMPPPLLEGLG
ncbi:MAG: dihydrofolate reductase [Actinomycetaceae bacterium]|nr:dihydrofolate reductase [Actinomycetaceae bacterium]